MQNSEAGWNQCACQEPGNTGKDEHTEICEDGNEHMRDSDSRLERGALLAKEFVIQVVSRLGLKSRDRGVLSS
jgi:hypothetical protein